MIDIRQEQPSDIPAIRAMNRRAFGQDQEGDIVDALRANGAALLSLVATLDERLVGHIMFSAAVGGGIIGAALGPMAVSPEHQRQGIGSQLVETGVRRIDDGRCLFIVVAGHPAFYPRFGFEPARGRCLHSEWELPDDAFMVRVLDETKMAVVTGLIKYRPEFSLGS